MLLTSLAPFALGTHLFCSSDIGFTMHMPLLSTIRLPLEALRSKLECSAHQNSQQRAQALPHESRNERTPEAQPQQNHTTHSAFNIPARLLVVLVKAQTGGKRLPLLKLPVAVAPGPSTPRQSQ
eukprot:GHVU01139268.1.p2 GENE.GHVU01139268.1~~GHVU01139268.1.p2  ORF type:complete len:124 (-),score=3.02 GHVU01139268.1:670-1041(-)